MDSFRDSPWGKTQRDQKWFEFGKLEYDQINDYYKNKIEWFASSWDLESLKFFDNYKLNFQKLLQL